jgi:hypothetical protein
MTDTSTTAMAALVAACRNENASGHECAEAIIALIAERDALAVRVAELEARALLDGIAMTKTAIDRDKAIESRDHWRQKAGR